MTRTILSKLTISLHFMVQQVYLAEISSRPNGTTLLEGKKVREWNSCITSVRIMQVEKEVSIQCSLSKFAISLTPEAYRI
jgi:hypothetical protein